MLNAFYTWVALPVMVTMATRRSGVVFSHDREQNCAKSALALMEDSGVAATPDNFELFYAYASGENPALMKVMAAFINAKKEFTPEILADLRLRCLSGARAAQALDTASGNIDAL